MPSMQDNPFGIPGAGQMPSAPMYPAATTQFVDPRTQVGQALLETPPLMPHLTPQMPGSWEEALRQRLQARARPLGARVREATREAAAAPEIRSSRKTKELVFVPEGRSGKKKGKAHGEDGARGKQGKGRKRNIG